MQRSTPAVQCCMTTVPCTPYLQAARCAAGGCSRSSWTAWRPWATRGPCTPPPATGLLPQRPAMTQAVLPPPLRAGCWTLLAGPAAELPGCSLGLAGRVTRGTRLCPGSTGGWVVEPFSEEARTVLRWLPVRAAARSVCITPQLSRPPLQGHAGGGQHRWRRWGQAHCRHLPLHPRLGQGRGLGQRLQPGLVSIPPLGRGRLVCCSSGAQPASRIAPNPLHSTTLRSAFGCLFPAAIGHPQPLRITQCPTQQRHAVHVFAGTGPAAAPR